MLSDVIWSWSIASGGSTDTFVERCLLLIGLQKRLHGFWNALIEFMQIVTFQFKNEMICLSDLISMIFPGLKGVNRCRIYFSRLFIVSNCTNLCQLSYTMWFSLTFFQVHIIHFQDFEIPINYSQKPSTPAKHNLGFPSSYLNLFFT